MKILVLNGPNLNMLGIREPGIYGSESYADVIRSIEKRAEALGVCVECIQSNHEGVLVDEIQRAYFESADGMIINPGAYTHTSIALLDAVKATGLPCIEVHVSDPDTREDFRHVSYIRAACVTTIKGHGTAGYIEALDFLVEYLTDHEKKI
jgi:3-dehydroquinate dehydratase type II